MGLLVLTFFGAWSGIALMPVVIFVGLPAWYGKWRVAYIAAVVLLVIGAGYWIYALTWWGIDGFSVGRRHAGIATGFFFTAWPGFVAWLISKHRLPSREE